MSTFSKNETKNITRENQNNKQHENLREKERGHLSSLKMKKLIVPQYQASCISPLSPGTR